MPKLGPLSWGEQIKTTVVTPDKLLDEVGVKNFVDNLSDVQQESLRENLWGRLEFDTPYSVSNQERFVGAPGKFTLLRENLRLI